MLGVADQGVIDYVGTPALLEMCAEESVELSHACLKMARKLRDENPTPKTLDECRDNLAEELADVMLCVDYITKSCNITKDEITSTIVHKQNRWIERLQEEIN